MIGHDSSKLGDWYEEDYVLLQLLRLLAEEIDALRWEVQGDGGRGIDCRIDEDGRRVAVQCRTFGKGRWTLGNLNTSGLLAAARDQIESEDADVFRFVTDATCPDLDRLKKHAETGADLPQALLEAWEALLKAWDFDPANECDRGRALKLLSQFDVRVVNAESLSSEIQSKCGLLAGDQSDALLEVLRNEARSQLTRKLTVQDVRARVEGRGIKLGVRADDPRIHDRLIELTDQFIRNVRTRRRYLDHIHRQESDALVKAVLASDAPRPIVVHGPVGSGKTEVLASAIELLRQRGTPLLVVTPDMDETTLRLRDDPIATLVRYASGRTPVLVIDQVDQAYTAGGPSHEMRRRCSRWIRRALDVGVTTVVGCRAVDAAKNTQLHHVLQGESTRDGPVSVPVGDLSVTTVTQLLADHGIAMGDLEPPARQLARRALFLDLMIWIHAGGGSLRGLRSLVSVMDRWWSTLAPAILEDDGQRATTALDEVIDRMESDGALSVPLGGWSDPQAIDGLLSAKVLVDEQRGSVVYVRPFHQVVADVRIAQRWAAVPSIRDLLARLGSRSAQGIHHARRLRLTLPLLLERPTGRQIIDGTVLSPDVRPLLQRAAFLALAELEPVTREATRLVIAWLKQDNLRKAVLRTVVEGRAEWMASLAEAGWLDETWKNASQEQQDELLRLLASVAVSWGDGVAAHLSAWASDDPSVLARADAVFLQEPDMDTDSLFEIRLEYVAHRAAHALSPDWGALLARHPRRAVRLLASLLERTPVVSLEETPWTWAVPEDLPEAVATLGRDAWDQLRRWWTSVEIPDLYSMSLHCDELSDWLMARVVDMLARNVAESLASGEMTLPELIRELPTDLREIDGWLLLRLGAALPEQDATSTRVHSIADELCRWLISDDRWLRLSIGMADSWNLRLAREFITKIAALVSEEVYRDLESRIVNYSDSWSAEQERQRISGGWLHHPTRSGLTAWRLLPALPERRRSQRARRTLQELDRKFRGFREYPLPSGGTVTSVIPERIANEWSVEEWITKLESAQASEGTRRRKPHQLDSHTVGVFEVRQLAEQLERLARRAPRKYVEHARAFDETVPAPVRARLLTGVTSAEPPQGLATASGWEPLDDGAVGDVLRRPQYLREPACLRAVARTVRDRPEHAWSDDVVDHLIAVGSGASQAALDRNNKLGLLTYRFNEIACMALEALAAVARNHEDRRGRLLALAVDLATHDDPGRRASAAALAAACASASPDRATTALLTAAGNPEVAMEPDVRNALLALATDPHATTGSRRTACELLLNAIDDPREDVATTAGQVALRLREFEVIDDAKLEAVIAGSPVARGGIAIVLTPRLQKEPPEWLLDLTVRLADDPDEKTGDLVVQTLRYPPASRLVEDRVFLGRLLKTSAARRDDRALLEACDRQNTLIPLADRILDLASTAAAEPAGSSTNWKRHRHVSGVVGLIARLVEETERENEFDLRTRALDAWDRLIEAGTAEAGRAFDDQVRDRS